MAVYYIPNTSILLQIRFFKLVLGFDQQIAAGLGETRVEIHGCNKLKTVSRRQVNYSSIYLKKMHIIIYLETVYSCSVKEMSILSGAR